MNIDERCYGYEPAQSELQAMRKRVKELEAENARLLQHCFQADNNAGNQVTRAERAEDERDALRAAGGPRPKDDLVERMKAPCMEYLCTRCSAERHECIDEITRLRERVAELQDNGQRLLDAADSWKEEAQRNQRLVAELRAELETQYHR